MERVTGIGGIFLQARDAAALRAWYRDHLGVELDESFEGATFRSAAGAQLVWSVFEQESNYLRAPRW